MNFYKQNFEALTQEVVDLYYAQVNTSEQRRERDENCATLLQAKFKMYRLYKRYKTIRNATIVIQKFIRGFLGRVVFGRRQNFTESNRNRKYFSFQAIVIQRYYRGYIKRKYYHDFYARKDFLTALQVKNDQFKEELFEVSKRERQEQEYRNEECAKAEFSHLASNLHHLTSTQAQPGIYRPPYAKEPPRVFEIEVEEHIRSAFKSSIDWKANRIRQIRNTNASNNDQFRIRSQSQKYRL